MDDDVIRTVTSLKEQLPDVGHALGIVRGKQKERQPHTLVGTNIEDLQFVHRAEDECIARYVQGLDGAKLASSFTYRTIVNPKTITQPLAPALDHFFNHQTHHRGQVHALFTGLRGRDFAPSLDLLMFQRKTGVGLKQAS